MNRYRYIGNKVECSGIEHTCTILIEFIEKPRNIENSGSLGNLYKLLLINQMKRRFAFSIDGDIRFDSILNAGL